jgi:hypothetical protein
VFAELITPQFLAPRGIGTFQPGLVFAPEDIAAAGDVQLVLMEDGRAVNVAGALLFVLGEEVDKYGVAKESSKGVPGMVPRCRTGAAKTVPGSSWGPADPSHGKKLRRAMASAPQLC